MKRGKDEEKTIGPMFPRLHVNDTERGGPRAPPRNKMALYEQLSIPSQRFNGGSLPRNSNSSNNLNPPWSTQGSGHERGMHFPLQLPPSVNPTEEPTRYADFNPSMVQIEPKKRHGEDFTVPIFDQSNMGKSRNGTSNSTDREKSNKFVSNQSSRQKCESPVKQINASPSFGLRDQCPNYFHRENDTNDNLQQQFRDNSWVLRGDGAPFDCSRGMKDGNSFIVMGDQQQEGQRSYFTPANDVESQEGRGDDVSETSMVDSMSGTDLSPDDVVGIIGQKHFWKARRAIVNQQRVFAVQVFELHRLIKVQKLIAESPHILLEDNAYMGKPPKGSLAKEIPLDIIVKATPKIVKHKDVSQLPDNRVESSAENAIEKTSLSSSQNGNQPSSHGPFLRGPPPTTVNSDTKTGSWCYSQPTGHQWLIPVMTPSEGLVYKPYPGPGFMGPVYGPPGSTPVMGNYLNYGAPLPHHPCQGLGPAPLAGHGYFSPFSMPVMHPSFSGSAGPTNHPNMQYQASCNRPSQKNGAIWNAVNLNPSKDGELQVSTASSPSERAERTSEGRNALPLFPMFPVGHAKNGGPGPEQPARVIKVVPHNARSATESVARIFHSIQGERKQYDSV